MPFVLRDQGRSQKKIDFATESNRVDLAAQHFWCSLRTFILLYEITRFMVTLKPKQVSLTPKHTVTFCLILFTPQSGAT